VPVTGEIAGVDDRGIEIKLIKDEPSLFLVPDEPCR
jgi:hypothetical protein